ncbi:MAG: hypothetical protein V1664_04335 [Candidatus Uhrbacteria bacterium]
MTFKQFIITMIIATLFVWSAWLFILLEIDPTAAGWLSILFFFITLSVSLAGTLSIIGTAARRYFRPGDLVSRQVLVSFRQAIWFSLIIVVALNLLAFSLFRLWIIGLVIVVFTFLELAFLNIRRRPKTS